MKLIIRNLQLRLYSELVLRARGRHVVSTWLARGKGNELGCNREVCESKNGKAAVRCPCVEHSGNIVETVILINWNKNIFEEKKYWRQKRKHIEMETDGNRYLNKNILE